MKIPNEHQQEYAAMVSVAVVLIAGLALSMALTMCGCASYTVNRDTGKGSSWGFLRSINVTESKTYDPTTGKLILETVQINTASNTGDVLMGLNELTGTLVDAAAKVKP